MDRLIKRFDAIADGDLKHCLHRGVSYQADMRVTMQYDRAYFEKFAAYDAAIADRLNRARIEFVNRHCGDGASVLDIGIGCGQFVAGRANTDGFDVNPHAVKWLRAKDRYGEDPRQYKGVTFWDVLEHVPDPESYLRRVPQYGWVFASVPLFERIEDIRASKHYKPGEHLYYWSAQGFIEWMKLYGFSLVARSDHEMECGRDCVGAFAFQRCLVDYRGLLGQYIETHATRHYGSSAGAYLSQFAAVVREAKPKAILDFGCGRSDLVAHFWLDGERHIARYDPGIPAYKEMPDRAFDLVFCCDVMEHIRMADVDRIFGEIRAKSNRVIFVISTKPARAVLPNGMNAHVTLLTDSEWMRWVAEAFGRCERIHYEVPHLLLLKTF
ncbi:MAG TPA: methyltransferase domain-containing protein [Burkholderiales bacterium]